MAWDAFEPREFAAGVALFVGIALLMLSALQLASITPYRRLLIAATALLLLAGLWWQLPWLGWSLGLAIAGMNAGFVLWLRRLGAAATRSPLASRSPRLQPVRQPDCR